MKSGDRVRFVGKERKVGSEVLRQQTLGLVIDVQPDGWAAIQWDGGHDSVHSPDELEQLQVGPGEPR